MSEPSARARSLLERAMTTLRTASLDVARTRFQDAAKAFTADGDHIGAVEARIEEARALGASFDAAAFDEADALLAGAAEELEILDDSGLHARLLHVQGYVHLRAGRFDLALDTLCRAEQAFRDLKDATGEARVLDTLGVLHERRHDTERAALCLAQSHALKQRAGDLEGVAISLGNLGRLALHAGKPREAEGFFRLDLEVARELGDTRGEALIRTNLAESLVAQGRTVEAGMAANQARALSARLGNEIGEGYARIALADVALASDDTAAARLEGEAALVAFTNAGMPSGHASAQLVLARVAAATGTPREGAARALWAARTARQANDPDVAIDALLEAHAQLERQAAPDRARRTLARAHDVAAASGQAHLAELVRARQTANDVSLAMGTRDVSIHVEAGRGELEAHAGSALTFEVEGFLGAGTTVTVLRVHDVERDRRYAWKQMQGGGDRAATLSKRMHGAYEMLARAEASPHLVGVHALGHRDGAPGLLLDLVRAPGRHATLDDALADVGRIPLGAAMRIAMGVARGLAALHAGEIVHGDVRPSKVLFGPEARAVLADCGLSLDLDDDGYVPTTAFTGTLPYAAPELLASDGRWVQPTAATDVYALGVLLYRSLTGRWPIPLEGDLATKLRSKHEHEIDASRVVEAPDALQTLIEQLCAREPRARPTAADAAAQLQALTNDPD